MKKIIFLAAITIIFLVGTATAQDVINNTSATVSQTNEGPAVSFDDHSTKTSTEAPSLIPPMLPMLPNGGQVIYISGDEGYTGGSKEKGIGDSRGYKLYYNPFWSNVGITPQMTRGLRKASIWDETLAWCKLSDKFKNFPTQLIRKDLTAEDYRQGLAIIGYTIVRGKVDFLEEATIMEGLNNGKEKTNAYYAMVLVNPQLKTKVKMAVLGFAVSSGKALGPASGPGETILSGTGGMGFGETLTWAGESELVKIVWIAKTEELQDSKTVTSPSINQNEHYRGGGDR